MKKIYNYVITFALLAIFSVQSNAQVFEKGTKLLSFGLGLGSGFGGVGYKVGIPPLQLAFDMGITDKIGIGHIGIGGIIGYSAYTYDFGGYFGSASYQYKYSNIVFGVRGTYHFDFDIDKLDIYGGVILGYNISSVSDGPAGSIYTPESYSSPVFGAFAGARYMFTEKFGAYAELGNAVSYLNIGITLKF